MLALALGFLQTPLVDVAPASVPNNAWPTGFEAAAGRVLFTATAPGAHQLWASDAGSASADLLFEWPALQPELEDPQFAALGGGAVFWMEPSSGLAAVEDHPLGLWFTDGTTAGTVNLWQADAAHPFELAPRPLVPHLGELYFALGQELWATDGTAGGTRPVESFPNFLPYDLVSLGDELYYLGDGLLGVSDALRVYRGPGLGSVNVKAFSSRPEDLTRFGDHLLLSASESGNPAGQEPWISDGTNGGTQLIADVNPAGASDPGGFTVAGGLAYFTAQLESFGDRRLWRTDGTAAGTFELFAHPGADVEELAVVDARAAFLVAEFGQPALGVTDGTVAGTFSIPLAPPGAVANLPSGLTAGGGLAVFETQLLGTAPDLSGAGRALWASDLTPGGTTRIQTLVYDATADPFELYSQFTGTPFGARERADRWWFAGWSPETGREVWTFDGTTLVPAPVADLHPGTTTVDAAPLRLTRFGDQLFFRGGPLGASAAHTWSESGLVKLPGESLTGVLNEAFTPRAVGMAGRVFFASADLTEVWRSDGTAAGTNLLLDAKTVGNGASYLRELAAGGGVVYASIRVGSEDRLFALDPDGGGATLLFEGAVIEPTYLAPDLYFSGSTDEAGLEPWLSDGTPGGTRQIEDVFPGPISSGPADFVRFGERVYFRRTWPAPEDAGKVYRVDEDKSGVELAFDVGLTADRTLFALESIGDRLVGFAQRSDNFALQLFSSAGDQASTLQIQGFGVADEDRVTLTRAGEGLTFFAPNPSDNGATWLWRSEGTAPSTVALAPFPAMPEVDEETLFAVAGTDLVFFGGTTAAEGAELWRTDGTVPGTFSVTEAFSPGTLQTRPGPPVRLGDRLVFAGDDPGVGRELLELSLSELGTYSVESLEEGCVGSSGIAPLASALGTPAPGQSLILAAQHAPPFAPAILGASEVYLPLGFGACTTFLGPGAVLLPASSDGVGVAFLVLPVPANPALSGSTLRFQWAVADPGGSLLGAFGVSDALEVTFGP